MAGRRATRELHPPYRPDVDGLRAVAVLSVVVFHFFPNTLVGGFVGVDVFFVISGFLISRIIIGGLEQGTFSFAGFYARRVRRIFPALLLVLAASLAFGWIALLTNEYEQLGGHAAASAAFVANFVFWNESGYFDNAAFTKPLLHLWSLSVEEQFYIYWPLFLWLAWRRRIGLLRVAIVIALLSFAANVIVTARDPVAAFYSPFTRFWELMLGAVIAHAALHVRPAPRVAALAPFASVLGGALVLAGVVFIGERNFPGWQALLPTAGAALLILAGPLAPLNRTLLSTPLMVGIGRISYPLYLWHWPLLAFARIVHGELGMGMKAMLLVATVVLAILTYQLVERPVQSTTRRAPVNALLCVLMAAFGGTGLLVAAQEGLEQRAVVQANLRLERTARWPPFTAPCSSMAATQKSLFQCQVDMREPPRFALLGDSKAGALFPGLFRTSAPGGTWLFVGSGASGPLLPVISGDPLYSYVSAPAVDMALRTIEDTKSVETVVIAAAARALFGLANDSSIADLPASGNYGAAFHGLDASVSRLVAAGKRVILLVDNPTLPHMEDCLGRKTSSELVNGLLAAPANPQCRITVARHLELSRRYRDLLEAVRARHPREVSVFDTIPILCDSEAGVCTAMRDGRLLYGVTDHISEYASLLVGRELNAQLRPAGAGRAP